MIDAATIRDILETYKKYGWVLRRALLTQDTKNALADTRTLFGGVPVISSDVNAAWFSRPPQAGPYAWEIRHLSPNPYALVEHIDEASPDFEEQLTGVESRLRTAVRCDA